MRLGPFVLLFLCTKKSLCGIRALRCCLLKASRCPGKLKDSPNKLSAVRSEDSSQEEVIVINKPGVHELTVVTTSDQEGTAPDIDEALDSTPVLRALYAHVDELMASFNEAAPFLELSSLYHLKVARLSCSGGEQGHDPAQPPAFAGTVA